jgi:NAD(P)H-flavin reductase
MKRDPMRPEVFRVGSVRRETRDTFTLSLVPEGARRNFRFAPGQFNMLYAFGAGEVPISISGDPDDDERCVHTIRAVGPVTRLLEGLKKGDSVGVRGPYGKAWPIVAARGMDLVIIAGGIGLAPLRPVIYYVLNHRKDYGRLVILYGARTPNDVLFQSELARWATKKDVEIQVTVDVADPAWRGHVGVVPKLVSRARFDALDAMALVCGPEVMMRYTIPELDLLGMSADRIHVSMERNMKCGVGFCGHCQYGSEFLCKDGPIFPYQRVRSVFLRKEL